MKSALTPEQWKTPKVIFRPDRFDEGYGIELVTNSHRRHWAAESRDWAVVFDGSWAVAISNDTRHALAALALHGQPFGFTREDVAMLRREADFCANNGGSESPEYATWVSLANRIEALLPPEAK